MIKLHARTAPWRGEARVFRLEEEGRERAASGTVAVEGIRLPPSLAYVSAGDILRVVPERGEVSVLYRRESPHNAVFLTENCNSNCVMCSQPPRAVKDRYLVDMWRAAIPLMSPETESLGMTGGEPTLLGDDFLSLLAACHEHLPSTSVHVLSNGRLFTYLSLARAVAAVGHRDLMIGIPLYADLPAEHDYVVQARGAFDQTMRGIINLARVGVPVEVRVVLHGETVARLPQLARFIARNLPFVSHVALMGLELQGYARGFRDALWIDPATYQDELRAAVDELRIAGLPISIYNHPLCLLDRALWSYARKSISDWKNEYLSECDDCAVRGQCGGFFSSNATAALGHRVTPFSTFDA